MRLKRETEIFDTKFDTKCDTKPDTGEPENRWIPWV
jgi:hypothetical protein